MSETGWTIDELAQRAAEALASEGVRAPNGRVSPAPDRRAIRWYATIGLLDRPLRTSGRVARYGERHLLQLLAVKRRQAEGLSLAEIQAELAGATEATLRRVAGRAEFWRAPPADAAAPATVALQSGSAELGSATLGLGPGPAEPGRWPGPGETFHRPVRVITAYDRLLTDPPSGPVRPVYPVPLHPAATLLLAGAPGEPDLAAIQAAARPLLDLLAGRGLLPDPSEPADPSQPADPSEPTDASEPTDPRDPTDSTDPTAGRPA